MIKKHRLLTILLIIIPYINYAYTPQQEVSYLELNPSTHKVEVKYYNNKIMNDFRNSLIAHRIEKESLDTSIKTDKTKFRQEDDYLNFNIKTDENGYPVVLLRPQIIRNHEELESLDKHAKKPIENKTKNTNKKNNAIGTIKTILIMILIFVIGGISIFTLINELRRRKHRFNK